jgi:hypothetical protein
MLTAVQSLRLLVRRGESLSGAGPAGWLRESGSRLPQSKGLWPGWVGEGPGLFEEAFGFEGWGEGGGPFGVAGFVGVEEVWEFLGFGVAGGVSEEGVGGDEGDLGSGAGGFAVEVVDGLDAGGWAGFGGGGWEDLAEEDGEVWAVGFEGVEEEDGVGGDGFRGGFFFEVVSAHEEDDGCGGEVEDIFLETDEHAAGGVAADAAVGGFEVRESAGEVVAPALGDGVAEEDDGAFVFGGAFGPCAAFFEPEGFEPVVAADGAGAWEAFVGGWDG